MSAGPANEWVYETQPDGTTCSRTLHCDDVTGCPGAMPWVHSARIKSVVEVLEGHSCYDKILNGYESDIDCGGPDCDACLMDKACRQTSDCYQFPHEQRSFWGMGIIDALAEQVLSLDVREPTAPEGQRERTANHLPRARTRHDVRSNPRGSESAIACAMEHMGQVAGTAASRQRPAIRDTELPEARAGSPSFPPGPRVATHDLARPDIRGCNTGNPWSRTPRSTSVEGRSRRCGTGLSLRHCPPAASSDAPSIHEHVTRRVARFAPRVSRAYFRSGGED